MPHMGYGVFIHRSDSIYEDSPAEHVRARGGVCGSSRPRMIARFAAIILACLASAGIAAAQTPVSPKPDVSARNPHADPLRGGWYPWDPYQYRDYRRGVSVLTGFDVEIERALERILGVGILLPETAWNAHLEALAAGSADIAAGATKSEARSAFAYFSKPYRSDSDVLILPKGAARRYAFSTIDEMLETFAKQRFRLGVVGGFVYADSRVNAFIADPAYKDLIAPAGSDTQNLQNLLVGVTDGFLADRIAAATTAWHLHLGARIEEHGLRFSTDIHLCSAAQPRHRRCWRVSTQPSTVAAQRGISANRRFLRSAGADQPDPRQRVVSRSRLHRHHRVRSLRRRARLCGTILIVRSPDPRQPSRAWWWRRARSAVAARPAGNRTQSRGTADRVRHRAGRDGRHQGCVARSCASAGQIPAIARSSWLPIDRGIRCRRACRLHGCRRRGRARHVGQAPLAVGSDRRRPHRLVRRPDAGPAPPRPRGRQPAGRALSRDRRRLGAGLCHFPGMGGRAIATGRNQT